VQVLVATTNAGKVREIRALLAGKAVELVTLDAYPGIDPPEETGQTFEENARAKALYYARKTGALTIAEDSGLEVEALGGVPGVESARYGGAAAAYPEKFDQLHDALRRMGASGSPARFVCAVAIARGDATIFEARGTVEGRIVEPRGSGGFGYDPIFFYPPYGCTFAEATAEQKAAVSHRGQAFGKVRDFLVTNKT
jgi:XTP/dITP diphosphohydrolase